MQFAIIPGVLLLLLLIPLNIYVQRIQKQLTVRFHGSSFVIVFAIVFFGFVLFFQTKQMKLKDQRIKMMNEVLNGIKVLKLYAWEIAFMRRVNEIRERELRSIRKKAVVNAISSAIWTFAPILVRFVLCYEIFVQFCHTKESVLFRFA